MKIVLDTNVLLSAIFFGGKPKALTDLILQSKISTYANQEIVDEYNLKLLVVKNKTNIEPDIEYYNDFLKKLEIKPKISQISICRDIDDNKFIECAIDNKCLYIVSGDKDLTDIKEYKNIKILKVTEFLDIYNKQ